MSAAASKSILVVGGAGAMGAGLISQFTKASWSTVNVDFHRNENASESLLLDPNSHWIENTKQISSKLSHLKPDIVISAAGGWAGGSLGDSSMLESVDSMWNMNVQSAVMAAHLSKNHLNPGGLLVLTGALAALDGTPDMFAYGISKAATHQLTKSAALSLSNENSKAIGILPVTIDTPTNRKFMADADWQSWTKVEDIAAKVLEWSTDASKSPENGALMAVQTAKNVSSWSHVG